jgi:alkylhydroperoxidase family enzyme
MAHLEPLPPETTPELREDFAIFERILGFTPNSLLTMQRMPAMVKGFGELTKAVMDPNGEVDLGFMRLVAHFASRAAGCQYCEAHSLVAAKTRSGSTVITPFTARRNARRWTLRWRPARCPTPLTRRS